MMDVLKKRLSSTCMEMKCTGLPQPAAVFQQAAGRSVLRAGWNCDFRVGLDF